MFEQLIDIGFIQKGVSTSNAKKTNIISRKYSETHSKGLLNQSEQGLLYVFLSELIENNTGDYIREYIDDMGQYYIDKAIRYISKNYTSSSLSVASIARYVNLDRSYFSHLFTTRMKTTPRQHLTDIRMDKACELFVLTSLSIGEIAVSVGYKDYIVFSKAFKRKLGYSPSEYIKSLLKGRQQA